MNRSIDNLTNPTRARLFFEIHTAGQLTAKNLLEKCPDISQPTLYRHLKAMLDDGVLKIVGEKQIRGLVEKSYAINLDIGTDIERIITENDGKGYLQLFNQYIMGIMSEFAAYSDSEDIDIINDASAFTIAPIYATQDEVYEALTKVGEIIQSLAANKQAPGRELRNLCIILTPPKKAAPQAAPPSFFSE